MKTYRIEYVESHWSPNDIPCIETNGRRRQVPPDILDEDSEFIVVLTAAEMKRIETNRDWLED